MCTVLLPPGDNQIAVNKYIVFSIPEDAYLLYVYHVTIYL